MVEQSKQFLFNRYGKRQSHVLRERQKQQQQQQQQEAQKSSSVQETENPSTTGINNIFYLIHFFLIILF